MRKRLEARSSSPRRGAARWQKPVLPFALVALAWPSSLRSADSELRSADRSLEPILSYIASGWDTLTRSLEQCGTLADPKLSAAPVLYLPADYPEPDALRRLEKECGVRVRHLEKAIRQPGQIDGGRILPPGLLYLEKPYVVPGGRFNEMYGWDSYFILLGLVRGGRLELARGMVENFFFEIQHYGTLLNANRTYYLTRSQPPFLTSMILAVYEARKSTGKEDREWLERAYEYAAKDYGLWTREPHLAGATGLSRYYDFGEGPALEGLQDETNYYAKAAAFFLLHPELRDAVVTRSAEKGGTQIGPPFQVRVCEATKTTEGRGCETAGEIGLSPDFYKGDRAMRESGFDVSFRFGPYGAATHHYAPVCLNSLLYKTEVDLARMSEMLGHKKEAEGWRKRAGARREEISKYLWDGRRGLFFDYDFTKPARSSYEYAATFYPLWAGAATAEQARAVAKNLTMFEQPGGIVMSRRETGAQWDFPYAWAPVQLLAAEGLRRYGFSEEANRVAYKFLLMVAENFRRDGTIREKYDAVARSSETQVTTGYQANVVGFGWTNGVFLELLDKLPREQVERLTNVLANASGAGAPK